MPPIVATGSGVTPQILDDPALRQLLADLEALPDTVDSIQTLEALVQRIEPWTKEWLFEEQVRSYYG